MRFLKNLHYLFFPISFHSILLLKKLFFKYFKKNKIKKTKMAKTHKQSSTQYKLNILNGTVNCIIIRECNIYRGINIRDQLCIGVEEEYFANVL